MAFFVTKSMAHIFSFADIQTLKSEKPSSQMKSDIPVIATAMNRCFTSDWESQMYLIILRVFQRSMLDESVAIGMVVLFDLLSDVYKTGTYFAGDECELILAPYPHNIYISYAMAAFMLSYRLLSKDRPVSEEFWEQVMEGFIEPGKVHTLERDFRMLLEENSKRYPPPPISPQDPAYIFYYDLNLPPNPLIHRRKYLRAKWAMYTHIRLAIRVRGGKYLRIDPRSVPDHKDVLLQFPPCYDYMMKRDILFLETRIRVPEMSEASRKEVHYYLEAEKSLRQTPTAMMRVGRKLNQIPRQSAATA